MPDRTREHEKHHVEGLLQAGREVEDPGLRAGGSDRWDGSMQDSRSASPTVPVRVESGNPGLGESTESESALAQKLVDRVWELNRKIGIPETTDLIKPEDIDELVDVSLSEGSAYPTPRFFDKHECRGILERLSAA